MLFVPATTDHAEALAPWMRTEDAEEVLAASGKDPLTALLDSIAVSSFSRAVLFDGEVACIFGVCPLNVLSGVGTCWLLTGELVNEKPMTFFRLSRPVVDVLLEDWPVLVNAIDARYTRAVRWVRWLGAEVGDPVPFGVSGLPFHPFKLTRKTTCVSH